MDTRSKSKKGINHGGVPVSDTQLASADSHASGTVMEALPASPMQSEEELRNAAQLSTVELASRSLSGEKAQSEAPRRTEYLARGAIPTRSDSGYRSAVPVEDVESEEEILARGYSRVRRLNDHFIFE